jgi:antirestriction protein ArdC
MNVRYRVELCAAFLCAHLDIKGELRHAGYVQDWITSSPTGKD